jgi:hypothetical protein
MVFAFLLYVLALGHVPFQLASSSAASDSGIAQTISGEVINVISGRPLPLVLVRCGSQAQLTDGEGRFEFQGGGSNATLVAAKPGYFMNEDPAESASLLLGALDDPTHVRILMFPEGVITGVITDRNDEPIPGVLVQPYRSVLDESGHHWTAGIVARTNAHGVYRLPLQAGEYTLHTIYVQPTERRKEAILPVVYPEGAYFSGSQALHLRSGETQHIDLHPQTVPVATLTARFEPTSFQRNTRISAYTSSGASFMLRPMPGGEPGEVSLLLPFGSYSLHAQAQARGIFVGGDPAPSQGQSDVEVADANVDVGSQGVKGVVFRFTPVNPLPIELSTDPSATSDNAVSPSISRLGLSLESKDIRMGDLASPPVRPSIGDKQSAVFRLLPGSYRLRAQTETGWFIEAAEYGGLDLLRQDLSVAQGAGTIPIRIVISNQTATLNGTLRQAGRAVSGWIYLMAMMPSATPFMIVHVNNSGSYTRTSIPPGSYKAIAFVHRHDINFDDPETLGGLTHVMQSITLKAGETGTLNMTITSLPEFP